MNLYDNDFYAWTPQQVALLRAGQLTEMGYANFAEELDSMGKSQKRTLSSQLMVRWALHQTPAAILPVR